MAHAQQSKKELLEIIEQLETKLKEVHHVEKQITAEAKDLTKNAVGLTKDKEGFYSIVKIKFDDEKNAAVIEKLERVDSRDEAIVAYKLNQFVQESIIRKARGGKYDK